jgi:hypothetical protein
MKKIILCVVFAVGFLSACSSDENSETPCTPIPCLNNGVSNSVCGCDCPQGFTGFNCATQTTPVSIKITKIKVKFFPNSDNGNYWDISFPTTINAWPDIYVTLENSNAVELFNAPTYFANVTSDGSNTWDFIPSTPISISFIYFNNLKLKLYDYDGAVSNVNDNVDDLMTTTFFDIYSATGGFPTTINVGNTTTPIVYELTLQYVW